MWPYDELVEPGRITAHASGQWRWKIDSARSVYFGSWRDPQNTPKVVLDAYYQDRDAVLRGDERPSRHPKTVKYVFDAYLALLEEKIALGRRSWHTHDTYRRAFSAFLDVVPADLDWQSLGPRWFALVRSRWTERMAPKTLTNRINDIRTVVNWAHQQLELPRPKFGPEFAPEPKHVIRAANNRRAPRIIEPGDIRRLLDRSLELGKADLHAQILLGINCAMTPIEVATLSPAQVDFSSGWLEAERPKTAVKRVAWLWPETVAALRPFAQSGDTLFWRSRVGEFGGVVGHGLPLVHESTNQISKRFRPLCASLEIRGSFSWLRISFKTFCRRFQIRPEESIPAKAIMGHIRDDEVHEGYADEEAYMAIRALSEQIRGYVLTAD